ncbi:UNVERIFIED_CONTAM: hypothetical protein GTU68_056233 [Idotea baltica]|nr:hypothetical protein [Idotea baltica]
MSFTEFLFKKLDRTLITPVIYPEDFVDWEPGKRSAFIGEFGEQLAAKFLRHEGLPVLYRNYRAPRGGEVDVVCKHAGGLVFVEVKTRTSVDFGRPASAVNLDKQRLISKGALSWLRELNHPDVVFRFDIVEVVLIEGKPPQFTRLENAFRMPGSFRY